MYCLTHLQLGKMAAIFMNDVLFFDSRFVPKGQIDNKHSIGSVDGFVSTRQQLPEPMLTYTFRREKKTHTGESPQYWTTSELVLISLQEIQEIKLFQNQLQLSMGSMLLNWTNWDLILNP